MILENDQGTILYFKNSLKKLSIVYKRAVLNKVTLRKRKKFTTVNSIDNKILIKLNYIYCKYGNAL